MKKTVAMALFFLCVVALGEDLGAQQTASSKPRVFVTDSQSWEMRGAGGGDKNGGATSFSGGARPQTVEIIKTFGEKCPQVTVTRNLEKADFVVTLDHEGGKGYARRRNKVAVFNKDGDSIFSKSTRSLGHSVEDACEAITATLKSK